VNPNDVFDVVVCNPPFYKNILEAQQKNQRKVKNLRLRKEESKNFGGRSNELWYKGGEEAFVKSMVLESIEFKNQVHWFTSLISQRENLRPIKKALNKICPSDVKVIEMDQGNKKSRFIACTFR
jgi:23S rRNA (adenine1618-N6)-methyltransferase